MVGQYRFHLVMVECERGGECGRRLSRNERGSAVRVVDRRRRRCMLKQAIACCLVREDPQWQLVLYDDGSQPRRQRRSLLRIGLDIGIFMMGSIPGYGRQLLMRGVVACRWARSVRWSWRMMAFCLCGVGSGTSSKECGVVESCI